MQISIFPDFQGDSLNYHILTEGVKKSIDIPGACCEIGLRRGMGTKCIIDALVDGKKNKEKPVIAIDPYGNIDHIADERDNKHGVFLIKHDYTNQMRNDCLINMYIYCVQKQVDFYFFNMTDLQFFKRFDDGFPCYIREKEELVNEYSFVHFDGPHTVKDLKPEIAFFHERSSVGSVFAFDDLELYDHPKIDKYLKGLGWEVFDWADKTATNHKASYVRIK